MGFHGQAKPAVPGVGRPIRIVIILLWLIVNLVLWSVKFKVFFFFAYRLAVYYLNILRTMQVLYGQIK